LLRIGGRAGEGEGETASVQSAGARSQDPEITNLATVRCLTD